MKYSLYRTETVDNRGNRIPVDKFNYVLVESFETKGEAEVERLNRMRCDNTGYIKVVEEQ